MTPQQLALMLGSIPPEQLAQMPHSLLYQAREYAQPDQQNTLAPYEHQAFAREATAENPWMAAPIAAGSLLYPFYKMATGGGRSSPGWDQVSGGLLGVGQGLAQGVQSRMAGLLSK